ncbi:hypothetical protein [Vibrio parahaemolyticus]|uniref:hypothetical protein n=1 Tax=Vibrio parahaemolyticus TaxID=670 RepID=UPI0031CCC32C
MKIIEIKPNMVKVVIGVDLKDFDEIKQILIASPGCDHAYSNAKGDYLIDGCFFRKDSDSITQKEAEKVLRLIEAEKLALTKMIEDGHISMLKIICLS